MFNFYRVTNKGRFSFTIAAPTPEAACNYCFKKKFSRKLENLKARDITTISLIENDWKSGPDPESLRTILEQDITCQVFCQGTSMSFAEVVAGYQPTRSKWVV